MMDIITKLMNHEVFQFPQLSNGVQKILSNSHICCMQSLEHVHGDSPYADSHILLPQYPVMFKAEIFAAAINGNPPPPPPPGVTGATVIVMFITTELFVARFPTLSS